jgi:5-methylcytosine-specific restriction protein A
MKPLQPCKIPGCPNLVRSGYCDIHKEFDTVYITNRNAFNKLDKKKTKESIAFYNSRAWKKVSINYRKLHPICEQCEKKNIIIKAQLVHHKKKLQDIWKDKQNPLSYKYLESLCNNCHLAELRTYRKHKYLY